MRVIHDNADGSIQGCPVTTSTGASVPMGIGAPRFPVPLCTGTARPAGDGHGTRRDEGVDTVDRGYQARYRPTIAARVP